MFVDDLSVATGRPRCHGDGPSGAHDVSMKIRDLTEEEKGSLGLINASGSAFRSPFAQWGFGSRRVYSSLLSRSRVRAKRKRNEKGGQDDDIMSRSRRLLFLISFFPFV